MTKIETIKDEQEFDLELVGNYGTFKSSKSYPVDYFLSTLSMVQAKKFIKFARDLEMREINFDLLMQRDIWEDRVRKEIIPYLTQAIGEGSDKPIFFPPILLAIVPIQDQHLQNLYAKPCPVTPGDGLQGVKWPGHFQLYGKESDSEDALALSALSDAKKINAKQAVLSLRTTESFENGVDLVVIDGQHRLRALKLLYDEDRDLIKSLILPTCILFPPESHTGHDNLESVPTVPRVFRSLFVDVNSTMETVGGHFTILLSDKNLGDITCRAFCEYVLEKGERESLALVEWNTRTKKNSFNVTRPYTLTSIGIIKRSFVDNFTTDTFIYYLFDISSGDEELFPEKSSEEEYFQKIKWDSFSYAQSKILSERAKTELAPLLYQMLFKTRPFSMIAEIFFDALTALKEETKMSGKVGTSAKAVLRNITELAPLNEKDEDFKKRYDDFESNVEQKISDRGLAIARYALFQRGVFNVAAEFMRLCLQYRMSPSLAMQITGNLLEKIFSVGAHPFSPENIFAQFTIFEQKKIRTREDTRKAIKYLLLAHMLNADLLEDVFSDLDLEISEEIKSEVKNIAFASAGEFLSLYRREREKSFRKNYDIDYSLSRNDREKLKILEMEQRQREKEVQEGDLDPDDINREFDSEVKAYVDAFTAACEADLKKAIGIEIDILERSENDEDETVED